MSTPCDPCQTADHDLPPDVSDACTSRSSQQGSQPRPATASGLGRGRRAHYGLRPHRHLWHPATSAHEVGELLAVFLWRT